MKSDLDAVLSGERQWVVLHADNAEVLPLLPDKSVAHVITDPPYEAEAHTLQRRIVNGGADRGGGIRAAPLGFDAITAEQRHWAAREMVRVCGGWVLAFCQIEAVAAWRDSLTEAGAKWRRGQVWRKPNGQPQMTGDRPGMGFECIATAWAGVGKSRWNGGGRHGFYEHATICQTNLTTETREHETQKPIALMLELVSLFTCPGDLILDCYAGSGTLGVAALRLGRRCILVERNGDYARVSSERLTAESQGQSLREYRAGQLPLLGGTP